MDMVENRKVLLEKVDTFKNIIDSLTNYVSVEKFSWYREAMGIVALVRWIEVHNILFMQAYK